MHYSRDETGWIERKGKEIARTTGRPLSKEYLIMDTSNVVDLQEKQFEDLDREDLEHFLSDLSNLRLSNYSSWTTSGLLDLTHAAATGTLGR